MSEQVAKTGIVPMPDMRTETVEGGHCIVMCGYNNKTKRFTCMNSWSQDWGDQGFFTIPYQYVMNRNLAADFWAFQGF